MLINHLFPLSSAFASQKELTGKHDEHRHCCTDDSILEKCDKSVNNQYGDGSVKEKGAFSFLRVMGYPFFFENIFLFFHNDTLYQGFSAALMISLGDFINFRV
jgi:hypothetical protein